MTHHHRTGAVALVGATIVVSALAWAAPAPADPADPVAPVTTSPVPPPPGPPPPGPMTPNQQVVPAGDPAAPPPDPAVMQPRVPPVQNQTYGSGKYGGGIMGTLKDLWDQAKNPMMTADGLMAPEGQPTPPPGAGPAPALPPGYVSTNAPGSETASTGPAGGPATGRPALPPGYYSVNGPPPPGYQYGTPGAPVTTVPVAPPAP